MGKPSAAALYLVSALLCLFAPQVAARPVQIDDILKIARLEQVAVSPDSELVAAVVQRPAEPGEIYGRTYYELDPSRSDIVLISRRSGAMRNLTSGAGAAAG